jgi:hypothetical protein
MFSKPATPDFEAIEKAIAERRVSEGLVLASASAPPKSRDKGKEKLRYDEKAGPSTEVDDFELAAKTRSATTRDDVDWLKDIYGCNYEDEDEDDDDLDGWYSAKVKESETKLRKDFTSGSAAAAAELSQLQFDEILAGFTDLKSKILRRSQRTDETLLQMLYCQKETNILLTQILKTMTSKGEYHT